MRKEEEEAVQPPLGTRRPRWPYGWTHFRESPDDARREFSEAGLADRVKWLARGSAHAAGLSARPKRHPARVTARERPRRDVKVAY